MTDIKEGDYVEWAMSQEIYRVLSTSGEMAQIGRKHGDIERVFSVRRTELHLIDRSHAVALLSINEEMVCEKEKCEERLRSLRRQWMDQWTSIHKSRNESR